MSIRVDSQPLLVDSVVVGNTGLGVLAESVPGTGTDGPGYLYNCLSFPEDSGKEVRGEIITFPAGVLTANEDSGFRYDPPSDGERVALVQVYADGVAIGAPISVFLNVGSASKTTIVKALTALSSVRKGVATTRDTQSNINSLVVNGRHLLQSVHLYFGVSLQSKTNVRERLDRRLTLSSSIRVPVKQASSFSSHIYRSIQTNIALSLDVTGRAVVRAKISSQIDGDSIFQISPGRYFQVLESPSVFEVLPVANFFDVID